MGTVFGLAAIVLKFIAASSAASCSFPWARSLSAFSSAILKKSAFWSRDQVHG